MALSVSQTYTGNNDGSSATVSGVTAAIGRMAVVLVATDNSGTAGAAPTVSVTDAQGNTYTQRGTTGLRSSGSDKDGAAQYMFTAPIGVALSSQSITVSCSPGAQIAVIVYIVAAGSGEAVSFVSAGTPVTGSRTSHACTAAINVTNGRMFIGHAAVETGASVNVTGDTDTVNGSWSTLALAEEFPFLGQDSQSMSSAAQYKIVTATGNQTWAGVTSSSRDSAANYMILEAVPAFTADGGVYTVTGTAATLQPSQKITTATAGAYALTGADATVSHAWKVTGTAGSFTLTGGAATVERAYPLTAEAGSFAVSAPTAALVLMADNRVPAIGGEFVASGASASMLRGRVAPADVAFVFVNGTDASFSIVREIVPSAGSFALSGAAAGLVRGRLIGATAGSFTITGTGASLVKVGAVYLGVDAGSYSISGTAATLTPTTPVPVPGPMVHAPSYAYWLKKKKRKALEPPKPPKVEVTIDPAVQAQIEAAQRGQEMLRRKQDALSKVVETRSAFAPQVKARTVQASEGVRPQPPDPPRRKTKTVRPKAPASPPARERNYRKLGSI